MRLYVVVVYYPCGNLVTPVLLLQALCGVLVDIPTLTGEKIPINLANEVIKPNTVKKIAGYGLPLPKERR